MYFFGMVEMYLRARNCFIWYIDRDGNKLWIIDIVEEQD